MVSPVGPALDAPTVGACPACGTALERLEDYALDIAGQEVIFHADRCPSCANEYVNAPETLRPDSELLSEYRPNASPLGPRRRIVDLSSRGRDLRKRAGPKVAGPLPPHLVPADP